MPLHVYQCSNCDTQVEKLTKSATIQVPISIKERCVKCKTTTRYDKIAARPVIRTTSSTAVAIKADRRRKNPDWKYNVIKGLTADGRPGGGLKAQSAAAWSSGFNNANPDLADARNELPKGAKEKLNG